MGKVILRILNVQMPAELYEAAQLKAKQQYTSLSTIIRQLLAQWLAIENKEKVNNTEGLHRQPKVQSVTKQVPVQNPNVGHEIKLARIIAKLSQKEVAAAVGITVPYLSMIENDAVTPSARLLRDLKEAVRWTPQIAAL